MMRTFLASFLGLGFAIGGVIACTASTSGTASACQSLTSCCLGAGVQEMACLQIVESNVDTSCASELIMLTTTGACASTGTSTSTSSGPITGTGCEGLSSCCDAMTGASRTACLSIANAGSSATCSAELANYQLAGACGTTTSSESSSGPGSTSTSGPDTSSSSTDQSSQTSGTGPGTSTTSTTSESSSSSTSECTPHALPSNFTFRTIGIASGSCTSADDEGVSSCISSGTSCASYQDIPGCGSCALSSYTSSTWGPFAMATTAGGSGYQIPFINTAGCIQKLDPSGGAACAQAIDRAFECELEACLAYCPVASASDSAGMAALLGTSTTNGCLGDADSTVCSSYVSAEDSACDALFGDAGTDPGTMCDTLADATDSGPYIALFCGGEDAGI